MVNNVIPGRVFWITGLSGAGKTTISRLLHRHLLAKKQRGVIFLDGDELRKIFSSGNDFSVNARKSLANQYSNLCCMLSGQGFDVVCATISMFEEVRNKNRLNIKNYTEIYINVSLETVKKRDSKNVYSNHEEDVNGLVVNFNENYQEPKMPDIVLKNDGELPPLEVFNHLLGRLKTLKID